jgi:hypothetical protein
LEAWFGFRSALERKAGSGSALKSKFKSFGGSKLSPGAVDAHNGGLEAQNGALESLWSQIPITLKMSRIQNRIQVKSWIRIRIQVIRIRNPAHIWSQCSGLPPNSGLGHEGLPLFFTSRIRLLFVRIRILPPILEDVERTEINAGKIKLQLFFY